MSLDAKYAQILTLVNSACPTPTQTYTQPNAALGQTVTIVQLACACVEMGTFWNKLICVVFVLTIAKHATMLPPVQYARVGFGLIQITLSVVKLTIAKTVLVELVQLVSSHTTWTQVALVQRVLTTVLSVQTRMFVQTVQIHMYSQLEERTVVPKLLVKTV